MATGDQLDMLGRIKAALPASWFQDETPVLDALLSGLAYALSFAYSLIDYVRLQTRISTATEGWLDLISVDFFGSRLPRRAREGDVTFRRRILAELLREKATRQGMIRTLTDLTGRTPVVFEPQRPADTGAYSLAGGYGVAGGYGSLLLPAQAFVVAYRPTGSGIPYVAGYGCPEGAYSTPSRARYSDMNEIVGAVTDADIYAAIDNAKPAGTTVWAAISS